MLGPDAIEKVKTLLASAGWNEVVKVSLAQYANSAIKALILMPSERVGEFKEMSDGEIRERIRAAEWLLSAFANEVAVAEFNRRLDELKRQESGEGTSPDSGSPPANP
jgi:hypothetical protein